MIDRLRSLTIFLGLTVIHSSLFAEDLHLHRFERQQLTDVYFSEGANFGDLNRDGKPDVVHGPYWWQGPDFKTRYEIFAPKPQNRDGYSTNFFTWVYDYTGDGWNDLVSVGLPGSAAILYVNPGEGKVLDPSTHWKTHKVFDGVGNESPLFLNLVGDETPELVCNHGGTFGYAVPNGEKPWTWHPISGEVKEYPFGHGLGVGDVNGDGRMDVIWKSGWYEQPASVENGPQWAFHKYQFAGPGGADMYAYDVDGDGDNDIITSLAAHTYGLAWFEQVKDGTEIGFKKHVILGDKPEDNPYGVLFTEPHAVALHDMDGDGLKDIVTGKTYWSHHRQSPLWDAGAVVYWFKLVRNADGVDWVPYRADDEAGIGRQLSVGDIDGDKLPDIVVGGMKGAHILHHRLVPATKEEFKAAQPRKAVALSDGLSPEDAAARMTVPEGFSVQLAAGEPLVHQPIAFTTDARGRLWVAEAYTYPNRAKDGQGRDKIVILEDTDGDGKFESRKVFIEGLNLISGLEVGYGGVWVGAAPYLMFIPDQNGDDVPDAPVQAVAQTTQSALPFPNDVPTGATVLLDGFGWQDTHETLNSFIWGPDGWLYGCHGVFTHSKVGKPGATDAERQGLNAGVWRYHPTRHQFEVFSHGTSNPWGVDFNDQGQAFITACVIPHLWHMVQGARYHRQGGQHFNPYTFEDIQTIADHLHYVGNIRDHAWWGHEPQSPTNTLAAGGGHAHAGAMIYLGDNWPAKYRNQIFMNNVHGNRVNECLLERRGSGYVGHRAPDTMIANDRWYRGLNLKYGPDGSVYLIDWYDKNACHRTNPEIWDRTNGRVYNIRYGTPARAKVDLYALPDSELVMLQLHSNDWYVRTARRILAERAASGKLDPATAAQLAEMVKSQKEAKHRLRAVWALHSINQLSVATWELATNDADEFLRAWAIQLACEAGTPSESVLARFNQQAKTDQSAVVRLYLASALQRLPVDQRWELASSLLAKSEDATDHNLPLVLWYGVEPLVVADSQRAIELARGSKIEKVTRFIVRRAASTPESANSAVDWLASVDQVETQQLILDELKQAFEGRVNIPQPPAWGPAYDRLVTSANAEIKVRADQIAVALGDKRILPRMRDVLANPKAELPQRQRALELLVKGRDSEAAPAFTVALNEPDLRAAAIRALAAFDDAKIAPAILAKYSNLSEAEKRDAINTLVARPGSATKLFDAIEAGEVPRTDVHAYHIQQLLGFKDEDLAKRITSVWGEIRATAKDKLELIAKHKVHLTAARLKSADLVSGRRLFVKTCAACHTLFGEGGKIGPDITGSNRANLDYILENVLDPSAIVGKDYRMTVIVTTDGRTVSGLIQKETDSAVTIRTINDTVVVAKSDIDERKLSELSLMPEGQLNQLTPEEQRDLIAYLGTPTQVALRGPKSPIDRKTGRVPMALEGEAMKIIDKSKGTATSQPMGGFTADRWSGNDHLWWTGGAPGAVLELELPVATEGAYDLEVALTMARDYGIVQLLVDGETFSEPIDCFNNPDVVTTGILTFGTKTLAAGNHRLGLKIIGANPNAVKAFMVGLDYVRLVKKSQ